jgi:hypothetical protein
MIRLLLSLLLFGAAGIYAADDLNGYARLDKQTDGVKPLTLEDPGFENNGAGWGLRPCAVIEKGAGRSATHALKYHRTNPKEYAVISTPAVLTPGAFYRFGAWVKTEDVTTSPQGGGATVALEFSKTGEDGKKAFLTGRYLKGVTGTGDWQFVSDTVRVPKNATGANISLYIWKGATGTAWFDDIVLQEQGTNLWTLYLLNPYNTVSDGKCTVAVSHDGKTASAQDLEVRLNLKDPALTLRAPVRNDRAEFALDNLAPGEYDAGFMILNPARKEVLYSTAIPLTIKPGNRPLVAVDRLGRTLVDGKPFMPVGVFSGGIDAAMLDTLRDGGFNTVLPYSSMSLRTGKAKSTPEQIVQVMDMAAAKGIKVIFSCKDIGSAARYGLQEWHGAQGQDDIIGKVTALLKDHPALLAWYINDEQPSSQIQRVSAMRRLFNRLDPNHPTYGVLYQYEDLPLYGPTCDIIGVDPYPLAEKHIGRAVYAMTQARFSGLPIWAVPQMSNTEVFRTEKAIPEPQNPSEEKYRSLVLLEAVYGAKGFIFYKFEDLKSWKLPKGNFEAEWMKMKNIAAMLKILEPYILSARPAEILSEGKVTAARLYNDGGKAAILICATGPDSADATFKLDGNYRSLYGRTVLQDGAWKFTGEGISSDLLLEQ